MTDTEYVADYLRRHPAGACAIEIISASLRDREVGCTVHSRVADLRAQGYTITCQIEGKTRRGRERYIYRLVSEPGCGQDAVREARVAAPCPEPEPEPSVEPLEQMELIA